MKQWHKNRSFWESYKFALSGIREAYMREANVRRQIIIFIPVIVLGLALRIPVSHMAILVLAGGLVLSLELVNSALEEVEDIIWPEYREAIKRSKDVSAGAVLLASTTALVVGLLILFPPLAKLLLLLY